jgi:3-oxoacyl-[acyl-carrier protein] reductase
VSIYSRRRAGELSVDEYLKAEFDMDLGLKDRIALVTGTANKRGNGRAIALALAQEGADIACVDINLALAGSVAQEIKDRGRRSIAVGVDQSDAAAVRSAAARIREELGPVDILVNNAAVATVGLLHQEQLTPWEDVISIDLSGPYYWIRECMGPMIERKWGRIINISSLTGEFGGYGQCSYSASKGALVSLAKTAALEGASYNITANAITLGMIATDMSDLIRPDLRERLIKRTPQRKFGDPQDVANLVAFLASDRAGFITGANIVADGGFSLFVY